VTGHPALEAAARAGVRLGLERITSFLEALDGPQRCAPVVHVAGTNGKGSVCAYVTEALRAAGYRVGTTISPHVQVVNERVQIDGVPIGDAELVEAIETVDRARSEWAVRNGLGGDVLTYFELITAVAFHVFARRAVDVMVVEVGMGGRLDATNVVDPAVCAIPSLGLDHVRELGPDLASIATEKAGVIKNGRPGVVGPVPPEARRVFEQIARLRQAPLWSGPELVAEHGADGRWTLRTPAGVAGPVRLQMVGPHQGSNAVVALGALHRLREAGLAVADSAIAEGFARASVPARLERLAPDLVIDGAHNLDGTRALAAWLASQPRPKVRALVFGMGEDRDPVEVITPLLPHFDRVVTTRCSHPKARESAELAEVLRHFHPAVVDGGPIEQALPAARAESDEVIVGGSLFVAGAARSLARGSP
jgi:dihydrofolate synthase / folylpolyglutamate synthase